MVGLSVVAVQMIAALGSAAILFPGLVLAAIFIYFMGGLIFYHALAANAVLSLAYLAAGTVLQLPGREFGYDALSIVAVNLFCASVVYMHEKTSRIRFLEAALLREMVARDGLTGIQNRRMFDQHIQRAWHQAVRDSQRVAVLLVDIDCFKDYNDRYGHQAGDDRSLDRPRHTIYNSRLNNSSKHGQTVNLSDSLCAAYPRPKTGPLGGAPVLAAEATAVPTCNHLLRV